MYDFILAFADSCVLSRVLDLKGGGMVVELQSWVKLPLGWIQ